MYVSEYLETGADGNSFKYMCVIIRALVCTK